jgi:hypothetical protein
MGTTVAPLPSAAATLRVSRSVVRHLPTAARVLMGALFLFSGVLGLVMAPQPTPRLPAGAVAFAAALAKTGYMMPLVSATEAIVGLLLLANRFVPLALALLAPVVINIFAFHLFLEPSGRAIAVVVCALELYLAWGYRGAYRPMLAMRAPR